MRRRGTRAASQSRAASPGSLRRVVVTVCPLERGVVVLPITRTGRRRRLDAPALARSLRQLVAARGLEQRVEVVEGCAGGCGRAGPNVDVRIYPVPGPGEKPTQVALDWKTYVYSLASLDCVATILDEHLGPSD